ncbi:transcriptional regulator, AbrB family (plasmid) [Ammonifex degensii KC4]|uniref:Transcriptional regulator, AbrB family n=1 Tax=Ammonifex degensii (strain DSM 10501 / KC4) TaxID=429009 RepID=C9RDG3_AMMDK|nr:AbrB/MazE/SpoVT family DNA-binding domain-containing protein [Ammonifex degensii]ACX53234.1 transcriptional regulator, AbrB family [Ammonifex degensii KC4]
MIIIETARLGSKYQMVLPLSVRKALGVSAGDELLVLLLDNAAVLLPKPKSYADHLLGLHREVWADINPEKYLEEMRSWGNS